MKFKIILGRIGSDIWANCRLKIIHNELNHLENAEILDVGCGSGYIGGLFTKNNKVTFADINEDDLKRIENNKNVFIRKIDITKKLPFKNESFDVVICGDVIEHLEDDKGIIKEITRILGKDGTFILTTPAYSKFYGEHDKLIGHYRRYNKDDYLSIAQDNDFKIKKIRYVGSSILLPFILSQRFKRSKVFYTGKSSLEGKITPILNLICKIDVFLRLPFGICIIGIFIKNESKY